MGIWLVFYPRLETTTRKKLYGPKKLYLTIERSIVDLTDEQLTSNQPKRVWGSVIKLTRLKFQYTCTNRSRARTGSISQKYRLYNSRKAFVLSKTVDPMPAFSRTATENLRSNPLTKKT